MVWAFLAMLAIVAGIVGLITYLAITGENAKANIRQRTSDAVNAQRETQAWRRADEQAVNATHDINDTKKRLDDGTF